MFKAVFKSINKRKLATFFIIIQISFTFFTLNDSIDSFFVVNKQEKFLNNVLKEEKDNIIRIFISGLRSKSLSDKFLLLEEYINSMEEINYNGGLDSPTLNFDEFKNNTFHKNMIEKEYNGSLRGEYTESSDVLIIDEGLENLLNLRISEGRNFSNNDFNLNNNEYIPVILGNNFKDFINIGDILTDSMTFADKKKFIVVGFLENDFYTFNVKNQYISNLPSKLDNFIIIPTYEEMNNLSLHINSKLDNYFVIVKDKNTLNDVITKIKNKMNELGIEGDLYTYEEELADFKTQYKQINITSILIITFLLVMSLFSLISAILFSIKKRKYTIGVMITCGANNKYIKSTILLEIFLITTISFIISCIATIINKALYYINFLQETFTLQKAFNDKFIFIVFIIILIFVILAAYIPLVKVGKLEAKDLIGRNE